MEFLKYVHPWYQPVVELMMLTGMINSEIAGLRVSDIRPDYILVQHTIVRGVENDTPKTLYRIRKRPITQAIRQQLDILLARNSGDKMVTTKSGTYFNPANFRKDVWEKAGKACGITDKVPYSMRHSFAAWALILRIDSNRLVRLMGHGSKQMIYEVYGDYIEGLDEDFWQILQYFGQDFAQPKKKQSTTVGYGKVIPYQMQQPDFPQINEAPNLPFKTF
jgi:integrase